MQSVSPASSVRSMKAPARKAGEFCRVKIDDTSMESVILDVMDVEQKAKIKTIGYGIEMTLPLKELYPSQGKEARNKQDVAASEILGGINWSLKDQCLAPYGPEREMKLSIIYSLYDDEDSGQQCAIVASIDSNMALESSVWVHELKPPPQQIWNVGDHCRAEWSVDNVIYEGNILAFGEHEGRKFANVEFIGYGNQDNVWMETLMPSQGTEAIAKQKEEAKEAGVVVDDTPAAPTKVWKVNDRCRAVLSEDNIEYEGTVKKIEDDGVNCLVHFIGLNKDEAKALTSLKSSAGSEARAQQRASNQFKVESNTSEEWKEGSNVRAVYPEDGLEYEGVIVSIGATEGGDKYATIKFLGYGNEESVWFQDILASRGEEARAQQIKDAGVDPEVPIENEMAVDEIDSAAIASSPQENGSINGLKNWKVGDNCRAIFETDGIEYEGKIEEITAVDDGTQYALVKFHGYGNTQTAWLADVLPSLGTKAIDAQVKASDADNEVEVAVQAPVDLDNKKEEPLVNGGHAPEAVKEDKAGGQDVVVSVWKVNDFVRAYCKELDEEREGQIHVFHPSKKEVVKVKFLNTGAVNQGNDIIEVKTLSELKPSEVQPATIQESKLTNGTDAVDHGSNEAPNDMLNESSEPSPSGSEASTVIEVAPMKKASIVLDGNNNNNNVSNSSEITRVSSASDDAILQATAMLAEQLASAKVIEDLRKQVAERDKKLRIAEERNEVNEIIFREMRLANSQLQAENTRLKENEAKFHKEHTVLMKDIKTLLAKVDHLKQEKISLLGEIVQLKASIQ